jgi:hypothetical protein
MSSTGPRNCYYDITITHSFEVMVGDGGSNGQEDGDWKLAAGARDANVIPGDAYALLSDSK